VVWTACNCQLSVQLKFLYLPSFYIVSLSEFYFCGKFQLCVIREYGVQWFVTWAEHFVQWLPTWCTDYYLFIKYYSPLHVSSLKCSYSGGYSYTNAAYGTVTLYESSWRPVGTQLEWELTVGGRLLVGRLKTPYQQPSPYSQFSLKLCTERLPRTLIESDSTICCMYTIVSSWRWALKARNM